MKTETLQVRNLLYHRIQAALAGFCLLTVTTAATAATVTWTGGGSDANWSTAGNWNSGVPNPGDSLILDGSAGLTANNDLSIGTAFSGILFPTTAGGFLVGGNAVDLSGATLLNNSYTLQELDFIVTNNSSLTFDTENSDFLLTSRVSGTGTVLKLGPGTLTLAGADNYGGLTTISNGTMVVSNNNGNYTIDGATLMLNFRTYYTGMGISLTRDSSVGIDLLDNAEPRGVDLYGTIGSPGFKFTKIGEGILRIVGSMNASQIDVAAGTLSSLGGAAMPLTHWGTNLITVESGAMLRADDGGICPNLIVLNGGDGTSSGSYTHQGILVSANRNNGTPTNNIFTNTITLAADSSLGSYWGNMIISGNLTGPGALTKLGGNPLVLGGANTYGGNTTISAGAVVLASSSALPGGATNGDVLLNGATTLDLGGFNATVNGLADDNAGLATIDNSGTNASTLTFGGKNDGVNFAGKIKNSGGQPLSLTKIGTSPATFTGPNTFSGGLSVQGGSLELNIPTGVTTNGAISLADGTQLTIHKTIASSAFKSPSMTLGSAGATTLSIDLAGFGSPSVPLFTVTNGAGAFSAGGTITINIAGDSSLISLGQFPLIRYTTRSGNGTFVMGTLPANVVATIVTNSSGKSIDLKIASAPVTTWVGNLSGEWDINTTKNWTVLSSPSVYLDGVGVLFGDAVATNYVTVTTAVQPGGMLVNATTNYTFDGPGGIYGGNLTKNGTGTLTLLTANGYNGTTISGGTLLVGNGGATGTLGNGNIQNDAALVFNHSDPVSFPNPMAGAGSLTKLNTNTLTIVGANSFIGGTFVSNGIVQLASGTALGAPSTGIPAAVITPGAGLDLGGQSIAVNNTVYVSGLGQTANNGAIFDSGNGTCIGCPTIGLVTISLTGDTALGNNGGMWEVNGGILGNGFALVKVGNNAINLRGTAASNPSQLIIGNGGINFMRANCAGTAAANTIVITNNAWLDTWDNNNWSGYTIVNNFVIGQGGGQIRNTHGAWYGHANYDTYNGTITLSDTLTLLNSSTYSGAPNAAGVVTHGTMTFNGLISGPAGIIANAANSSGGNIITLKAANTYAGPTVVAGGTLAISSAQQNGGVYTIDDGATLSIGPSAFTAIPISSLTIGTNAGASLSLPWLTLSTSNAPVIATNLVLNGANGLLLSPGVFATAGQYPLIKYTTISGGGTIALGASGTRGTPGVLVTNVANSSIDVVIPAGSPVTWVGNQNNTWDINNTPNWLYQSVGTTYTQNGNLGDAVTFDDSSVVTNINIAASVSPTMIIVSNLAKAYTFTNASISGATGLLKEGTNTLFLNNGVNTFTGGAVVNGGTVLLGNAGSLNNASGTVIVTGNGAVDFNNQQPTLLACTISGTGFNGLGTLVQNSGNNNAYGPGSITLAGSATIGGANRWDLRNGANTLNTPTNAYTLTKVGAGQTSLVGTTVSPNLGDIYVLGGMLGYETSTTGLGNPTNTLYIGNGGSLEFYAATVPLNKNIVCSNGASFVASSGNSSSQNIIAGPVTLVSGTTTIKGNYYNGLYLSNTISGAGALTLQYQSYVYLAGSNTYTGQTTVPTCNGSPGTRLSLIGNGSILHSSQITMYGLVSGQAYPGYIDVSGRVDGTLTLASGQLLRGDNGTWVKGNVVAGAGSTVSPGGFANIQYTTVSNALTFLAGSTCAMDVTATTSVTNDLINVTGTLTYGGTLAVNITGATPLAAGQAFKLFNAAAYAGSFAAITPVTPGTGLIWDTSALNTGVLKVAAVNTNTTPITWSYTGNSLNLSWPADHRGWRLLVQTNALSVGISTNWVTWAGSASVTNVSIPTDPTAPAVFFKLTYP